MARGRMINTTICTDKKINDLSSDTSRLAFTWLVAHADKEGRVHGDPAIVRSKVFPRRDDITLDQMEEFIKEWAEADLIEWYEAEGDMYICFPSFERNQVGLRKDREPESSIPPRQTSSKLPEDCRTNARLREVKLKEGKGREYALEIYKEVTNLTPDYYRQNPVVDAIWSVIETYDLDYDPLIEYLKKHFDNWCNSRTEKGRKYNPSNPKWLEWALTNFDNSTIDKSEAEGYRLIE